MDQLDYEMLGQFIVSEIRVRTPKVSGNLTRNTRFYGMGFGDVWGHIEIDTPYAQFVDYGYLEHQNSKKLRKDYLYVEKSVKRALKVVLERYGAKVR